jgi:HD-GYP domain-containing protein (c-di-GMP phosphodiesterase class II)
VTPAADLTPTETAMTRTEHGPADTHTLPTEPWYRLARYRDDLDSAIGLAAQIAATLRAARTECRADAAVWYSATQTESALVDAPDPDVGWAIEVARLALAAGGPEATAGTWVPADLPLALHPVPTAAAFARLRPARLGSLLVVSTRQTRAFDREAQAALRFFARTLALHHQHQVTASGLRGTLTGVFKSLVALLDVRDPYMAGHGERVGRIARRIGEQMGLSTAVASDLYLAGLLHDVGTLGVADEVLHHPGKLTGEEMGQMRRHVLIGDDLLASAKHVERLRPGVRNHHERWDGKGYPDGLRGDRVPLLARVIAVADACDALMSARRYRPPLGPPQIRAVLQRFAGSQWDPQVVDAFLACSGDIFPPIYQKGVGESAVYALSDVIASEVERSTILHAALLTGDRVGPS